MPENMLRDKWAKGEPVINGWLTMPGHFSAEIMSKFEWDSITIDMQHGLIDYQTGVMMLTALSLGRAVPLVRVSWLDPSVIMKCLDAGAGGVICPMISTREDAARLVSYCKYAPEGTRSVGPIRAGLRDAGYVATANRKILIFAMIETKEGLDNLEDILSVEGLTGVYIGPSDLGLSLGCAGVFDSDEEEVLSAIRRIRIASKARNLICGIHTASSAYARRMIAEGFDLVTVSSDTRILSQGIQTLLSEVRSATPAA